VLLKSPNKYNQALQSVGEALIWNGKMESNTLEMW
jgi:hypothetical protein